MALEGNISIGAPGSIPTPPAGEVTRFFNTDFSPPKLYYKDENDDSFPFPLTSSSEADCCACEIAEEIATGVSCALKAGTIKMSEFQTFVNSGIQVQATTTDDGQGNTTCNVTIGPKIIPVTGITVIPTTIASLAVGDQNVIVPFVVPTNATNKTVSFISSNPSIASVDSNGVVTGNGTGTTTIIVTTIDGNFVASCTVTVP